MNEINELRNIIKAHPSKVNSIFTPSWVVDGGTLKFIVMCEKDGVVEDITEDSSDLICGDMLRGLGNLLIVIVFGVSIDPQIQTMLVNGQLKIDGMTDDNIKFVFTDYNKFVTDTLDGVDIPCQIKYTVVDGYDS